MVKFSEIEVIDRLRRFFDVAILSFTVMSDRPLDGPTPMARLGRALGKGALFCGIVSGAAVYGAVEHRMSDKFQDVSVDQALLEVASSIDLGITTQSAKSEIVHRGSGEVLSAFQSPDPRAEPVEEAVAWFDEENVDSFAVQDALARWGVFKHGDGYRLERMPAPSAELQPSPWVLKSIIEEVSELSELSASEAAEEIGRELTTFMISRDLCAAGSQPDCLVQMTDLEGSTVVLEANSETGTLRVHNEADGPVAGLKM